MPVQFLDKTDIWTPVDIIESGIERHRVYSTRLGVLYAGDCLELLTYVQAEAIDTVFADPPLTSLRNMEQR